MNEVQFFQVSEDESGQRLDNYLSSRLKGAPKSLLYRIIRKGEVRVNKGRAKPDRRLQGGDLVRVPPIRLPDKKEEPKASFQLTDQLQQSILFDRDGLCIVNKPSGLAVHGGSGVNLGLIEAMRQAEGKPRFLELVHRLDRDTSGCIMIARKRSMLKHLQEGLREKGVIQKRYLLLVEGKWPKRTQRVDAPLLRRELPNGERVVKVDQRGKNSVTEFKILQEFDSVTLLEAKPLTGRTHQIRVHALHVGHALIGDEKYGLQATNKQFRKLGIKRLFLHAKALSFKMPDGEPVEVEAELPSDLNEALKNL